MVGDRSECIFYVDFKNVCVQFTEDLDYIEIISNLYFFGGNLIKSR